MATPCKMFSNELLNHDNSKWLGLFIWHNRGEL